MKIKHLLEDRKDYSNIIKNPFFQKYILPKINKEMFDGVEKFLYKKEKDFTSSFRMDRSLLFTLSMEVFTHTKDILLHGSNHGHYETGETYTLTHREGPRDSDSTMHNMVNKVSEDVYDEFIRNLMFVTRLFSTASDYADKYTDLYIIIPLDTPTFYYSDKYEDFFVDYLGEGNAVRNLLREVMNTTNFLVGDNEKEFKALGDEWDYDAWLFYELCKNSIEKSLKDKTKILFDNLTNNNYLETLTGDIKAEIVDHIEFLMKKQFDKKASDKFLKEISSLVSPIVDQYTRNIYKAIHNLAESYVKSVKRTNNFTEASEDSELMMDCNQFTVIEMNDFANIVVEVYKSQRES